MFTRIPTQHTRYQGNEYYLDGVGILMAAPILANDTPDWANPVDVDRDNFDSEELGAEAEADRADQQR